MIERGSPAERFFYASRASLASLHTMRAVVTVDPSLRPSSSSANDVLRRPARRSVALRTRARVEGTTEKTPTAQSAHSRRDVLRVVFVASSLASAPARAVVDAGDWSSPGLRSDGPPAKYERRPSGLVFEEVNEGAGEEARAGDVAVFEYVVRRANGYFIYATIDCGIGCGKGDPVEFELGPNGRLIPGLDELLTGMKPGGKRRALIKPEIAYGGAYKSYEPQPPEYGQKRQLERLSASNEPVIFEVKLVKTRQKRR